MKSYDYLWNFCKVYHVFFPSLLLNTDNCSTSSFPPQTTPHSILTWRRHTAPRLGYKPEHQTKSSSCQRSRRSKTQPWTDRGTDRGFRLVCQRRECLYRWTDATMVTCRKYFFHLFLDAKFNKNMTFLFLYEQFCIYRNIRTFREQMLGLDD